MDSNLSLGPFFVLWLELHCFFYCATLGDENSSVVANELKLGSFSFFSFLWLKLHGSLYWIIFSIESSLAIGSEAPKLKLESFFLMIFIQVPIAIFAKLLLALKVA